MKIAVTKASGSLKFENYGKWLKAANDSVEIIDLNGLTAEQATEAIAECSGLVFSGGSDIHPKHYGLPDKFDQCEDVDEPRDAMELALVEPALERNIPVLGICRGLQVINVAFGGTLVVDISTDRPTDTDHGKTEGVDAVHKMEVEPGSLIKRITRTMEGEINSAHHQAIDRLSTLFSPAAISIDGVIEAFEFGDSSLGGKPFLMAVQWHPERMDHSSQFSMPLAQHFTHEAAAFEALLK